MPPLQQYKSGDMLRLMTTTASGEDALRPKIEVPYTQAIVWDFDRSATSRALSGASKAGRPTPNHWHVLVLDPESDEWLPAAIRDTNGQLVPHIRKEHVLAEHQGRPTQYTTDELIRRVGTIANKTSSISIINE